MSFNPNDAPMGTCLGFCPLLRLCDVFPTLRQQIVFSASRKHGGWEAKGAFKHTMNVHLEMNYMNSHYATGKENTMWGSKWGSK